MLDSTMPGVVTRRERIDCEPCPPACRCMAFGEPDDCCGGCSSAAKARRGLAYPGHDSVDRCMEAAPPMLLGRDGTALLAMLTLELATVWVL